MSNPQRPQDGTGILEEIPDFGILEMFVPSALFSAVPANGTAGFAPGCECKVLNASTTPVSYINFGTNTSCLFGQANVSTGSGIEMVNTTITTVGAGTLTAAGLAGGVITRSGSVAAYTDTTATAAQILAAMGNQSIGTSWLVYLKNTVAFAETVAGGSGVTVSGLSIVPPNSMDVFLLTYSAASTFTLVGLGSVPLAIVPLMAFTALTTVGAGTITAAGIVGGVTNRTGSVAAFTDTTDTAVNIVAALPNAAVGMTFIYTYYNNTLGDATLTGGVGVTVTGTVVPQTCWGEYLVTVTALTTVTMQLIASGPNVSLQAAKITTDAQAGPATAAAGTLSGAHTVHVICTTIGANAYTLRTAAQMFADIPNCQIGFTYTLLIRNTNAGTLTLTAPDGNTTLTGTMTIAQNVTRTFEVRFASATTMTITSMGVSAAAA